MAVMKHSFVVSSMKLLQLVHSLMIIFCHSTILEFNAHGIIWSCLLLREGHSATICLNANASHWKKQVVFSTRSPQHYNMHTIMALSTVMSNHPTFCCASMVMPTLSILA